MTETALLARPAPRRGAALAVAAALLAIAPLGSLAQAATPAAAAVEGADAAQLAARKAALARADAATVGLSVSAVEGARSADSLGRERQGSGVVIGDGLVLTIGYLILEADHLDIVLGDGRKLPARVAGYDVATGFGLVRALAPLPLEPVPLGRSATVTDGEPLMVASGGESGDLSLARMVSRRPFSGYWEYHIEDAIFTAPARTDHSGAGLFNADGELVGIGSLVVADATNAAALPAEAGARLRVRGNMFVPIDLLKPILPDVRRTAFAPGRARPWLGLNCVEHEGRIRVVRVTTESPAEAAGLQPGDMIVAVDGIAVDALAAFYKTLWRDNRAERDVLLDVRRGGELLRVPVRAVDRLGTLKRPEGV